MSDDKVEKSGALVRDARGHDSHFVSVREASQGSIAVTESAWVLLGTMTRRNHIMVQASSANPASIVLAFSNGALASNDITSALCGPQLTAGASTGISITANLTLYARVVSGGGAGRVYFLETY